MEMMGDIKATFAKAAFCRQFNNHSTLPSPNLRKNHLYVDAHKSPPYNQQTCVLQETPYQPHSQPIFPAVCARKWGRGGGGK
jgi:hypothetical protein